MSKLLDSADCIYNKIHGPFLLCQKFSPLVSAAPFAHVADRNKDQAAREAQEQEEGYVDGGHDRQRASKQEELEGVLHSPLQAPGPLRRFKQV